MEEIKGDTIIGLSSIGIYGNQDGYTIVNFIMMYFIGAYIRLVDSGKDRRLKIFSLIILNSVILTIWDYINGVTAQEYCNPLVISEAILVFTLFLNIDFNYSKVINGLSKEVFAVFLLHSFFIRRIGIENSVSRSVLEMCVHIIVSTVGIFLVCWILGKMYDLCTEPLFKRMSLLWDINKTEI